MITLNLRRLAALMVKEAIQIRRDPSTLLIAFVLPVILLFLFGYGVSLDTARTRVGLSIQDDSAAARGLAESYRRSRWFDVARTGSVIGLRQDLVAGRIRAILVIPTDFGRSIAAGAPKPIEIVTDGSNPNTANFVSAYVQGAWQKWQEARAPFEPVNGQRCQCAAAWAWCLMIGKSERRASFTLRESGNTRATSGSRRTMLVPLA